MSGDVPFVFYCHECERDVTATLITGTDVMKEFPYLITVSVTAYCEFCGSTGPGDSAVMEMG